MFITLTDPGIEVACPSRRLRRVNHPPLPMIDFYPLIRRAVSALEGNTDQECHALLEHARNA
jgi:hypothetical protein